VKLVFYTHLVPRSEVTEQWLLSYMPSWIVQGHIHLFSITGPINPFITTSKQAYCNVDVKFTVWWKKLAFYFLSYCFREACFEEIRDISNQWRKNSHHFTEMWAYTFFKIIWFIIKIIMFFLEYSRQIFIGYPKTDACPFDFTCFRNHASWSCVHPAS